MSLRSALLLFALSLYSVVRATDFYITQPWAESVWQAGTTVKISWNLYENVGPQASGINIDLMDGDDNAANFLLNIANNLRPDATCFEWTIPKSVSSSDAVFVRITGLGELPNYRFSHRFIITGGEGPGVTVVVIPTATPIDVNALVSQMPTARQTGFPSVVSLINPNMIQVDAVTTTTISITSGTAVNRDRETSGAALSSGLKLTSLALSLLLAAILL